MLSKSNSSKFREPRTERAAGKQKIGHLHLGASTLYPSVLLNFKVKGCAIDLWVNLSHWESGFLFSKNKLTKKNQKNGVKDCGKLCRSYPGEAPFLFSSWQRMPSIYVLVLSLHCVSASQEYIMYTHRLLVVM